MVNSDAQMFDVVGEREGHSHHWNREEDHHLPFITVHESIACLARPALELRYLHVFSPQQKQPHLQPWQMLKTCASISFEHVVPAPCRTVMDAGLKVT